jgi:hypothetical protein
MFTSFFSISSTNVLLYVVGEVERAKTHLSWSQQMRLYNGLTYLGS